MYTCDKCGCEHTSRTTCPKCGAPVIIVNQDYLLRRQEWEAKQRANLRWKSREEAADNIKGNNIEDNNIEETTIEATEEIEGFEFINIASEDDKDRRKGNIVLEYIGDFVKKITKKLGIKAANIKERQQRIKRHKNEDHSLEVETDEEKASMEKMLLDHIVYKSNMKKYIGIAAAVLVLICGITYGIYSFVTMDRSDLMYFDGHKLISVNDGDVLSVDRGSESYSLVAYSNKLNSIVMKAGDKYVGFYEGNEWQLSMDYGRPMQQFIFSDSGRYLSYAAYDDSTEKYCIFLWDMKKQVSAFYFSEQRVDIVGVNDDGKVVFVTLDTTGYSLVLDMKLCVADFKSRYVISDSVSQAECHENEVYFIENGNLYACSISDRVLEKYDGFIAFSERSHIDEDVLVISENQLGEELLYITENGLWQYKQGGNRQLTKAADASSKIYYNEEAGFLYYQNMNNMYSVDSKGVSKLIMENMAGDVAVAEEQGYIIAIDSQNCLWRLDSDIELIDSCVTSCDIVTGTDACSYIKEGQLIYNDYEKTLIVSNNNVESADKVFCSGKYLYFADSSNVLWKIDKKGKSKESMGYVQLITYID